MVEEDQVLKHANVDAVFAAHAWPEIPAGEIHVARDAPLGIREALRYK